MTLRNPSVNSIDHVSLKAEASMCHEGNEIPSVRVRGCQVGMSALKVYLVLHRGGGEDVNWVVTGLYGALTSDFCSFRAEQAVCVNL